MINDMNFLNICIYRNIHYKVFSYESMEKENNITKVSIHMLE